uniref:Uncharacterized protein n=1 Tax=Pristionchus pacificus TaxID=54126 RepID=A0A2A6BJX7_PRIPA|eukprot:PDM66199.1 hypothetical protein PRIPAC_45424 [Pristionchus pacificus]
MMKSKRRKETNCVDPRQYCDNKCCGKITPNPLQIAIYEKVRKVYLPSYIIKHQGKGFRRIEKSSAKINEEGKLIHDKKSKEGLNQPHFEDVRSTRKRSTNGKKRRRESDGEK